MISQVIINGLFAGAGYALVALGFNLIFSTVRFIPLTHAASYTVAAYAAYTLMVTLGLPLAAAVPLAVVCALLLGGFFELAVYSRVRARGGTSAVLLLASLGLLASFQSCVSLTYGDQTLVARNNAAYTVYNFYGVRATLIQCVTLAVTLACFATVWLAQSRTRAGKMQRALANDPELARVVGIRSDRVYLLVFAAGSALGGLAGTLAAMDTDIIPTMGFNAVLIGIVAAITGGVGSTAGALLGGIMIGLAQHLGSWAFNAQWQDAIIFLILIIFLLLKPQGFLGRPLRKTTL